MRLVRRVAPVVVSVGSLVVPNGKVGLARSSAGAPIFVRWSSSVVSPLRVLLSVRLSRGRLPEPKKKGLKRALVVQDKNR